MAIVIEPPDIVLGIPGSWESRDAVIAAINEKSGGLMLNGVVLMDSASGDGYRLEIHDRVQNLRNAYAIAGRHSLAQEDLVAIGRHTHILYLIARGGSFETARAAMGAACGLLLAGGVAVKVETAGVAHSGANWAHLTKFPGAEALYYAYNTLVEKEGDYFSCGMHNLGKPDALVDSIADPEVAGELIEGFLLYVIQEDPPFQSGDTYRDNEVSPPYRLQLEPCVSYPSGNMFHNPYGVWRLTPA